MSDLPDLADSADLPLELPRPLPPRTWRDRLDDLAAGGYPPGRLVAAAGAVAVAAVVGWRLLAPPAPPPEMQVPFAEPAPPTAETGASGAEGGATAGASPAATAPAPGAAAPGAAQAATDLTTGGEVVVHVVGAVAAPGVQRLPVGARVVDAVEAAGGASPDADLGRINLAAVLVDGQQVYVLRPGEIAPPPPAGGGGPIAGSAGSAEVAGLVDINSASAAELEELPGVGPVTAEAIVSHREQNGPFASVDDLIDVRGIGEAKLEQLRDLATV
jgi:competence protein ComEA